MRWLNIYLPLLTIKIKRKTSLSQKISLNGRSKIEEQINTNAKTGDISLLTDKLLSILVSGKRIDGTKKSVENHIIIKNPGSSMNYLSSPMLLNVIK